MRKCLDVDDWCTAAAINIHLKNYTQVFNPYPPLFIVLKMLSAFYVCCKNSSTVYTSHCHLNLINSSSLPNVTRSTALFIHCLVQVQPRKTCTDMTEKLLTGTYRIKTNKSYSNVLSSLIWVTLILPLFIVMKMSCCLPKRPRQTAQT